MMLNKAQRSTSFWFWSFCPNTIPIAQQEIVTMPNPTIIFLVFLACVGCIFISTNKNLTNQLSKYFYLYIRPLMSGLRINLVDFPNQCGHHYLSLIIQHLFSELTTFTNSIYLFLNFHFVNFIKWKSSKNLDTVL
jgi:hypothetical protein